MTVHLAVAGLQLKYSVFTCIYFKFEISPEDRPDQVISGSSAVSCHQQLLQAINLARSVTLTGIYHSLAAGLTACIGIAGFQLFYNLQTAADRDPG